MTTAITTATTAEIAAIVTGIKAAQNRQEIGLIYQGMVGYNLADDDTEADIEELRGVALDYVREVCAYSGIHCADVGLLADMADWIVNDERTDQTTTPGALFSDAQWIDRNASDYRADMLGDSDTPSITDSDTTVYELKLDSCIAYVARGTGIRQITLTDAPVSWSDLLADWDTSGYGGSLEQLLADFGIDATSALDEADEDHDGPCKVWVERNFYAGTLGDTRDGYYVDPESGDNEPVVFDSFEAAQEWVTEREGETYYLGHGEAGRPAYTICKA